MGIFDCCCEGSDIENEEINLNDKNGNKKNIHEELTKQEKPQIDNKSKPSNQVKEKKFDNKKTIKINERNILNFCFQENSTDLNTEPVQLDKDHGLIIEFADELKQDNEYDYTIHIDPTAYDMITNPDSVEKLSYYYDKGQKVVYIYKTCKEKDNDKAVCGYYKNNNNDMYDLYSDCNWNIVISISPIHIQGILKNQGIELKSKTNENNLFKWPKKDDFFTTNNLKKKFQLKGDLRQHPETIVEQFEKKIDEKKIKNEKLAELLDDKSNFRFELKRGETLVIPFGCLEKYLSMFNLSQSREKKAIFLASYWDNEPASLEEVVEEGKNGNKTTYYVFNTDKQRQPICGCQLKQITIDVNNNNKVYLDNVPIFQDENEIHKYNCNLIDHAHKHKIKDFSVQQVDELVKMKKDTNYIPNKSILGDGYFEYETNIGNVVIIGNTMEEYKLDSRVAEYLAKKAPLYLSSEYNKNKKAPYLEKLTIKDENDQNKECFVLNPHNKPFFGKEENMIQISHDGDYNPYLNNNNNDKIFENDDEIHNFNCCVMEHIKTNNLGGETFEQLFDNNKQLIKAGIPKNSKNNNDPNINMNNMNSAGQNVNQQ